MNLKHIIFIVCIVISLLHTTHIAAQVLPDERELKLPSIAENYSPLELTVFGIVSAGAMTLMLGATRLSALPAPAWARPRVTLQTGASLNGQTPVLIQQPSG